MTTNEASETIAAIVITPHGDVLDTILPTDDDRATLEALYRLIGCQYVEAVRLPGVDMWVDDEGLINDKPLNAIATLVAIRLAGHITQGYAGTAVFTGPADTEGATTSLSPEQRQHLHQVAEQAAALHREVLNRAWRDQDEPPQPG